MKGLDRTSEIRIALMEISSGWVGRMEVAPQALKQGKVDVGVLQETKITDGIHVCHGEEYAV